MKLQSKIFIPVILSLVILGGSMYLLNRKVLNESYNSEIQKVLSDKENAFKKSLRDKLESNLQFSNMIANSYILRSAFVTYEKTNDIDTTWGIINSEVDRFKYGAILSKQTVPTINCYVPPGIAIFRSRSMKRGDNVLNKRRTIEKAINTEKTVFGLEIGSYGLDLRAISPVRVNNKFYGSVEVNSPLVDIIHNFNIDDYEAYAIIVNKELIPRMKKVDAIKHAESFVKENVIVDQTEGFEINVFSKIYKGNLQELETDYGLEYNHLVIPIRNHDNEVVASLIYQMSKKDFIENMNASSYSIFFIGIMIFIISSLILFLVLNRVVINPIKRVTNALGSLSMGRIANEVKVNSKDEVAEMQKALNVVNAGMQKMSDFAIEIGNENYESDFKALSEDDELGNTLIQVRDKLKEVSEQEAIVAKEEKQRKWAAEGHAKFAALLQNNELNLDEYVYNILSNLISYLDINQGAIFLLSKDKKTLIQRATYAYDRRKFSEQEVELGDGLLGNTAIEGKLVYITDLPEDYIHITSGLGNANPTSLLIVPMKDEQELIGVFELAAFRNLEPFEIEFCEALADNIAQSISRQQVNQQTKELLEQSQQQAEELAAQEEEMRQNLEEMQATQEEMARKEADMTGVVNALNSSTLVVEFDLDGNITNVNDKILKVFGFDAKDQVIGANHKDFYEDENYDEGSQKLWEIISKKETVSRKARVKLPNGKEIWLNETYSPVLDNNGNVKKVLNISFDITEEVINEQQIAQQNEEMQAQEEEMKQNLEEMQAQEEEMRQNMEEMQATQEELHNKESETKALLESVKVTVMLAEFSTEKKIMDINDKFIELFGVSKDMMIGQLHESFGQYSSNANKYERMWRKVLKGEIVNLLSEFKFNGKSFTIEETYSPVKTESGAISKVINVSVLRS